MRQPSTDETALAWWRAALEGQAPSVYDDEPQAGFYRLRLVKGGPWVPVRVWWESVVDPDTGELVEDEVLRCTVNRKDADPQRSWLWASPITVEAYEAMLAHIQWALENDLSDPVLSPYQPIDLTKTIATPTRVDLTERISLP